MPGWRAVGSSRLRVDTATLLSLLMRGVLVAPPAVLAELDPVRIVLLVLQSGVVAPFADATGQCDDVFHSCLFGGEKEKSLGFLGAVNGGGGSRGTGPDCPVPPGTGPYHSIDARHHDRSAAWRPDRRRASARRSPPPRAGRARAPGRDQGPRPVARGAPPDPEPVRPGCRGGSHRARLRHQGGDHHARGLGRRRQPERHTPQADRRPGHRPDRAPDPRRAPARRRALPHLRDPHGGRRRVRRPRVARGPRPGRVGISDGEDQPPHLPHRRRLRVSARKAHRGQGLRGPQVHSQPGLRRDVQGGAGRRRGAPSRRPLRAAAHRRHLRAASRHDRRGPGHPGLEPRRRHAFRPRDADVRHHRRRRVDAARVRRRRHGQGGDDRSAARDGPRSRGQEHRQPDGDDPGGGLAARLHEGRGRAPRVACGLRSGARSGLGRSADCRSRRTDLDQRLHERGDSARQDQGRRWERRGRHRTVSSLRYLALGDSYTIGTGASDESHAWPSIIASRLEAELTNPAVNGYTTLDLIREELPYLERVKPDLVSILIGVNDLVQGRTPDAYRKSLTTIYDEVAKDARRRVAAVSIPTWSYVPAAADFGGAQQVEKLTSLFNEIARDEATARGFAWVDIGPASTSNIGSQGWIASDKLHPGDPQYAAWADAIWSLWLKP